MRKTCIYLLGLLPLVGIAFVCWLLWPAPDPVSERVALVQMKHTRAEVIDVMGREPDTEAEIYDGHAMWWDGRDGVAVVVIDPATRLVSRQQWVLNEREPFYLRWWFRATTELGI
jgi:hypothetical protein